MMNRFIRSKPRVNIVMIFCSKYHVSECMKGDALYLSRIHEERVIRDEAN